jgi:hypothetical protein
MVLTGDAETEKTGPGGRFFCGQDLVMGLPKSGKGLFFLMDQQSATLEKATSCTTLGIVRTLAHCCAFATRPIVRARPNGVPGLATLECPTLE